LFEQECGVGATKCGARGDCRSIRRRRRRRRHPRPGQFRLGRPRTWAL